MHTCKHSSPVGVGMLNGRTGVCLLLIDTVFLSGCTSYISTTMMMSVHKGFRQALTICVLVHHWCYPVSVEWLSETQDTGWTELNWGWLNSHQRPSCPKDSPKQERPSPKECTAYTEGLKLLQWGFGVLYSVLGNLWCLGHGGEEHGSHQADLKAFISWPGGTPWTIWVKA